MEQLPESNGAKGDPESTKSTLLETGASLLQSFSPPSRLCAHLHAFHVYASDPTRHSSAHHYCAHVNEDIRQCILYDSAGPNAKLIGVEYMVTPRIYETLDAEERKLWHSHVFEVKSGMLVMPQGGVPEGVWGVAENKEMEEVVVLYGKVWQLWQVERGDTVPLGRPELMGSFTSKDQFDFEKVVGERDKRLGVDHKKKAESRAYIEEPKVHEDADAVWKGKSKE
ncbi:DUF1264-domain-containing protein [Zymoseptoria brevis]|uniref:DUF1264-domain-containing protein n=1 Tax=Zymoseptoria brevis TaxID=1047168 RepID=A0A0F4GLR6_9PEZI|nr:DUF1264-domain-containing protein [Zymoseptoria brevis]